MVHRWRHERARNELERGEVAPRNQIRKLRHRRRWKLSRQSKQTRPSEKSVTMRQKHGRHLTVHLGSENQRGPHGSSNAKTQHSFHRRGADPPESICKSPFFELCRRDARAMHVIRIIRRNPSRMTFGSILRFPEVFASWENPSIPTHEMKSKQPKDLAGSVSFMSTGGIGTSFH